MKFSCVYQFESAKYILFLVILFSVVPGSQLYQFLLLLLEKQQNQTIIKWIAKEDGIFQIVNKDRLAELWGKQRQRKMTYDSLSRALCHYHKQNILKANPVKLRYQFTTTTLDEWQRIKDLNRIQIWCKFSVYHFCKQPFFYMIRW